MLLSLLVWMYITLVSLAWGNLFLKITAKLVKSEMDNIHPIIICLTGLGVTGIITSYLSLALPIKAIIQLVIVIPALLFYCGKANRKTVTGQLKQIFTGYTLVTGILLIVCIAMTLVLSTYTITHPDTLSYHGQAIKWMETYKAVPGLVHLDYELAMSNLWFTLLALFRFDFLQSNPYLFTNGCIIAWFFIFVVQQISAGSKNHKQVFSWLLLLAFTTLSWTQVRLTAASANPDFVAALFVWAAFYTYLYAGNNEGRSQLAILALLFSCIAITIKLSSIMIALLPIVVIIRQFIITKKTVAIALLASCGLCILPYLAHNYITSGYPFFPSGFMGFFNADWQIHADDLKAFQTYITGYAHLPVESYPDAAELLQKPFTQLLTLWWTHLALADQALIVIVILLLIAAIFFLPAIIFSTSLHTKTALVVSFIGSVVWFIEAPDPRFGTAFLIPLAYLLYKGITVRVQLPAINNRWLSFAAVLVFAGIASYSTFRFIHYCNPSQLLIPAGIKSLPYNTFTCQDVKMHQTLNPEECGLTPVPCTKDSCNTFELRGKNLTDGFRAAGEEE